MEKNRDKKCLGSALWPSSREVNSCHTPNVQHFLEAIASIFFKYLFTKIHHQMKFQDVFSMQTNICRPTGNTVYLTGEKPQTNPKNPCQNMETHPNLITAFKAHLYTFLLGWLFFVSAACEPKKWPPRNSHFWGTESLCCPNPGKKPAFATFMQKQL